MAEQSHYDRLVSESQGDQQLFDLIYLRGEVAASTDVTERTTPGTEAHDIMRSLTGAIQRRQAELDRDQTDKS